MNIKGKISGNPLAIANACKYLAIHWPQQMHVTPIFYLQLKIYLLKIFRGKNIINNKDAISYLHQNFRQCFSMMKFRNTTTYEIEKIIHSLKCKNSYGYDEISSRILKASTPYISSPLTYIFNKILSTGIFPDRLKFSEINPLYKEGDQNEFSNYCCVWHLHVHCLCMAPPCALFVCCT